MLKIDSCKDRPDDLPNMTFQLDPADAKALRSGLQRYQMGSILEGVLLD
jgi:hypothetical protein